jgi:hypothetical protein
MMNRRRQAVSLLLLGVLPSACGYGGALRDAQRESATPAPVVTVDPSEASDGVVTYLKVRKSPEDGASTEGGVRLATPEDLGKLHDAPADFKSFLSWQLSANIAAVNTGLAARGKRMPARCDLAARITVWGVAPAVATAREWWCTRDANEVIWVKDRGSWRIAARMRGGWDCSVLNRYRVPADITAAVCWNEDGRTVRRYNGPRD